MITWRTRLLDSSVIAAVTLISSVPYLGRVRFYSDDWAFLASLEQTRHRSLWSALRYMADAQDLGKRPLQNVAQLGLFRAFGLAPLGYHIAIAVVLALVGASIYLVLVEVGAPRRMAIAVATVYVLLPSYVTVRFWFATFTYGLTLLACGISTYGDVRALRRAGQIDWRWKVVAWVAGAVAGLGIEVAIPLLAANVVWVFTWARRRAQRVDPSSIRPLLLATAGNVLVIVAVGLYKLGTFGDGPSGSLRANAKGVVRAAAVQVVDFGAALPHTTAWAGRLLDVGEWLAVVAVVAVVALHLTRADDATAIGGASTGAWFRLVLIGVALFGISAALFALSNRTPLTGTGNANRVWMAASVGWSMILVGAIGSACSLVGDARRGLAYTWSTALLCGALSIVVLGISMFWTGSARQQDLALAQLQRTVAALPAGTTVLLDGVCPFDGPAPIYRETWDLSSRLQLAYDEPDLRANVVSDRMVLVDGNLDVAGSGEHVTYAPGDALVVFRYVRGGDGAVRTVTDARVAADVLATSPTRTTCADGSSGGGVVLLPFDRWMRSHS